jgi:predicted nucleic acid-binding protein
MSIGQNPHSRLQVVIDSNVLISGLNFPGNERQVLELGRERRIEVYISPFILDEVRGVLQRKFGQSDTEAEENIALVLQWATFILPRVIVAVVERMTKIIAS